MKTDTNTSHQDRLVHAPLADKQPKSSLSNIKETRQQKLSNLEVKLKLALANKKWIDLYQCQSQMDRSKIKPALYATFVDTGLMATETGLTVIKSHALLGSIAAGKKNTNQKSVGPKKK